MDMSETNFHGKNPGFVKEALDFFGVSRTLEWFGELGLVCKEEDGRIYPACGQASAVLDVLRLGAARRGVRVLTGQAVKTIDKIGECFQIYCERGEALAARKVIISTGGLASPFSSREAGGGPEIMKRFGHHVREPFPALVQIKSESPFMKALKGVRADGRIALEAGGLRAERTGEIQFTGFGVSGIPAMDLSGFLYDGSGKLRKNAALCVDFAPAVEIRELAVFLSERKKRLAAPDMEIYMTGLFHKALGAALVKAAGIGIRLPAESLAEESIMQLAGTIKNFRIPVSGTKGFRDAQVMGGGLDTDEFDPAAMESRIVPGLYACGEILDIYGDCGGYNLQWAWSSGHLAGFSAAGTR